MFSSLRINLRSAAKISALLLVLLSLTLAGCGTGSNPISVTISPSAAQSAVAGQVLNLTGSVSSDPKAGGVTWSLTGPGALSGQSATAVTYTAPSPISASATATITATSVSDATKSATLTVTLQPVLIALSPSAAQTLDQGQTLAVSSTVSNDPQSKGVTWSLSGAGALSAQTASGVTYTAPASVPTASSVTLTATSVFDNTKTATLTINLVTPPAVTSTSLAAGQVGTAYTASLTASNGVPPYAWSVTSGTLPGGLTLSGSTISGTPTAYGTFNFTVQVKDTGNLTATANLSIKIAPQPLVVSTTSLPNIVINTAYSATLQSTGGATPITWSVTSGALPTGIALAANGALSGTPSAAGTFNFTVQAADSSSPQLTATKALSITVIPALSITTSALANGITSTSYSATLASTGGSGAMTWSVTVGSLPAGLSLNASTGAITGSPTAAGTSSFTVQAADSGTPQQKVTKALSITVIQQLIVSTSSLPTGSVTSLYSATLSSSGGVPAVTWSVSVGSLPAGLSLNAATGAITGTPTGPSGTANFTVQATDSGTPQQSATAQLSIIITPALAVTTTSPMASGTVGTAYSQSVQTNGGGIAPITWSVTAGALPGGLSLNSSTGAITGTPNASGTFNFTVQVADSGTPQQKATAALSISIATAPLSIATTGLPQGVVGQSYSSATLQSAGGTPPVTWSISTGSLPAWATLNASTGAITGTPNAAGSTTFTVKATDSTVPTPQTATKQLTIQVNTALSITTASLPGGTTGTSYSATLQSSGGATPISWSISVGSLPTGLSLNSGTGLISGNPSVAGTFNFTVQATDSTSPTPQVVTQPLSITITVAPLVINTTSSNLPSGTINTAYPSTALNASGGIPPYSWTITAGALPTGLTLSSAGQVSGTPTASGTFNFTAKVTDSATPTPNTQTAALSITVNSAACGTGSETLLNGHYALVLKGFDSSKNPVLVGAAIVIDGAGHVSSGVMDMNLNAGTQTNLTISSGTYSVGSDHRGCMAITSTAGTQNFRFSLGSISSGVASLGNLIEFDSTGPFITGRMFKQNTAAFSTAQINGSYAFGVSSAQNSAACNGGSCGGKFAAVGVFNFSAGSVTGGVVDFNANGQLDGNSANTNWPASPVSIASGGSYTVSGTTGRGALSFTPAGASGPVGAAIYVVSASQVLILGTDTQTNNSIFTGEAWQQSGAPFSNSSLNGTSVLYSSALGSAASPATDVTIGLVAAGGSGTFTFSGTDNDSGTISTSSASGNYAVASNGRTILSGAGVGNHPPLFYVVSSGKAFFLESNGRVGSGFFEPQSGSPFSTSSANGAYAYGSINPEESVVGDDAGVATFTSSTGALSAIGDHSDSGGQSANSTNSMTYSIDSTGLGHIPANCTLGTTCQTVFYVISSTKAVVIDVTPATDTNPKLQIAQQ